jgi:two-component system, NtrC family, C4-dicarboxylate transport sensor histidine kinase DctB
MFRGAVLIWLLLLPVLFYALYLGGRAWLSDTLHETSSRTLSLYVTGLEEMLNKYRALPDIYALHPTIQDVLENSDDDDVTKKANHLLQHYNEASGASDTYVLDASGLTLAASNWNKKVTFVGRNFSFRPYFRDAMKSGRGQFFALGTMSLQRGYYMSRAVKGSDGKTTGVVVVKVDVAQAEQGWDSPQHKIIVTDGAGIVFLSSEAGWLYNAVRDPSPEALAELGQTRRYANKTIGRLPFIVKDTDAPWHNSFQAANRDEVSYLATYQDLSEVGWRVWIMANTSSMTRMAIVYAAGIVLVVAMGFVAVISLIERRRGLLRALDVQRQAHQTLANSANELERQVEVRTTDLKRAQNELVQAGKMAALGQMSVGINHELNQPLTAIRSYTDNVVKFLDLDRTDEARENLSLISALSERMGDIILRLKIFARESSDERMAVSLNTVINNTMRIVDPRLKKTGVELQIDVPEDDICVLVNDVRLEQVLVNLINNAIDALPEEGERRITLEARIQDGEMIVRVHDSGPGIAEDIIAHLFEPFFTTKEVGIGLGLGLSISYGIVQDFGGELRVRNPEGGGAEFYFNIPLADSGKGEQRSDAR